MSRGFSKNYVADTSQDVKKLIGVKTDSITGLPGVDYEMSTGFRNAQEQRLRHDVDAAT